MADNAHPHDVKDPAVFVDMPYDNPSMPPPPFSAKDEASEPLLDSHEKEDPPPPTPEDPQPRGRCCFFRNRLGRRRCSSEERAQRKTRAKRIFRICFLAALAWYFLCPIDNIAYYGDDLSSGWGDTGIDQDYCMLPPNAPPGAGLYAEEGSMLMGACNNMRDLVPWNGTDSYETKAHQLRVTFADGNMAANVHVRSGDVKHTMVYIRANVTKVHPRDGDEDQDDDDDDDDDDDQPGLHVRALNMEDLFDLYIWADAHVPDDDHSGDVPATTPAPALPTSTGLHGPWPSHFPRGGHRERKHRKHHRKHSRKHHRKHHDKAHGKKHHRKHHGEDRDHEDEDRDDELEGYRKDFCAVIEVDVVVPRGHKDFTAFDIQGTVLSVTAEDLDSVRFENINVSTKFGEIRTGALRVDHLSLTTAAGGVSVDSVRASTPGSALRVAAESGFGNIVMGVLTSAVKVEDDTVCPSHSVYTKTTVGSVDVGVTPVLEDQLKGDTVPGDLYVQAHSSMGDVFTAVNLMEDQQLHLDATTIKGTAKAFVEDSFLGHLSATALVGKAEVLEQTDSDSVIVYEKNTGRKKVGYKVIEDSGRSSDSSIAVHTTFGRAIVAFQ